MAASGFSTRRDATVYAAGELASMSYLASLSVGQNGMPRDLWARLYRSDPDGKLLGPLRATHIAAGDVPGLSSTFNSAGPNGRGLVVTNRPFSQIGNFDRTEFRGRLPDGWDAELYRNGTLVAFDSDSDGDGDYLFKNIDVLIGDNDYEIVLHGPQGQEQRVRDTVNVGTDSAPPGKLWYWAGVRQPGKDLLSFAKGKALLPSASGTDPPLKLDQGYEAVAQAQYGIDKRTAVAALVRSALRDDARVTYVEGSVRRSLGPSVVELAGLASDRGERSARAQVIAKLGKATITASSLLSDGLAGRNLDDKARNVKSAHRRRLRAAAQGRRHANVALGQRRTKRLHRRQPDARRPIPLRHPARLVRPGEHHDLSEDQRFLRRGQHDASHRAARRGAYRAGPPARLGRGRDSPAKSS